MPRWKHQGRYRHCHTNGPDWGRGGGYVYSILTTKVRRQPTFRRSLADRAPRRTVVELAIKHILFTLCRERLSRQMPRVEAGDLRQGVKPDSRKERSRTDPRTKGSCGKSLWQKYKPPLPHLDQAQRIGIPCASDSSSTGRASGWCNHRSPC